MADDTVSFRFQVKPAKPLKSVFELLCDTDYNPTGLARIDVIGDDFRLTVGKSSSGFQAQFSLDKNDVSGFECNESVVGKIVNLSEVVQKMGIQKKDSVTVSHTLTSDKLSFIIKNPDEEYANAFTTTVVPNTVGINDFPVVIILLERIINSENVDEYIFPQWPYNTMLKLASLLCPYVHSSFPTMPPNSMLLRFRLPNLGELMFIKDRVFDETLANVSASLRELLPGPTSSADPNESSENFCSTPFPQKHS